MDSVPLHVLDAFGCDNQGKDVDFRSFLRLISENEDHGVGPQRRILDQEQCTASLSRQQKARWVEVPETQVVYDEAFATAAFAALDNGTGVIRH